MVRHDDLESEPWLRHLFNKLRKNVVLSLRDGEELSGELISIFFRNGILNLEVLSGKDVYMVNWKYVKYLKTSKG